MPSLVPVEKLLVLSPTTDVIAAQQILDGISGSIRDRCGWGITKHNGVADYYKECGLSRTLVLPTLRLNRASVVVTADDVELEPDAFIARPNGILILKNSYESVVVEYEGGYDVTPESIMSICIRYAMRDLSNLDGASSWQIGSEIHVYGQQYTTEMIKADSGLDRYTIEPNGLINLDYELL